MSEAITIGSCLCGSAVIRVTGTPEFSVLCFCQDCQRTSGGGHLPQAAFVKGRVDIAGPCKIFRWKSDAGNDLTLTFCSECGSPIAKTTSKMQGYVLIAVGLLEDQSIFDAPFHAYVEGCQDWDKLRKLPSQEV